MYLTFTDIFVNLGLAVNRPIEMVLETEILSALSLFPLIFQIERERLQLFIKTKRTDIQTDVILWNNSDSRTCLFDIDFSGNYRCSCFTQFSFEMAFRVGQLEGYVCVTSRCMFNGCCSLQPTMGRRWTRLIYFPMKKRNLFIYFNLFISLWGASDRIWSTLGLESTNNYFFCVLFYLR